MFKNVFLEKCSFSDLKHGLHVGYPGRKNRNLREIEPISLVFYMLCKMVYSFELANKHLAPYSVLLALFAPVWSICSLAPDGSSHLFFSLIRKSRRFYITYQKIKIGSIPRKLWPFESTPIYTMKNI